MTTIHFSDRARYDFAAQFLLHNGARFRAHLLPDVLSAEIEDDVMAKLLQRMNQSQTVVLPYLAKGQHSWMITGVTRRELDETFARASRFVLPTYAEFAGGGNAPRLQLFNPGGNELQRLGAVLYPAGYYGWRSPAQHLEAMLRRLGLWLDLEERQPVFNLERLRSYQELLDGFNAATAAGNWSEAEQVILELRQRRLTTADNLAFLQVQVLHQQLRWSAIWGRSDFPTLANLRMPRRVRAALLTAFHQSVLASLEQAGHVEQTLEALRQSRPRLGYLLTGRFELTDAPVVRVFAYLAALENDYAALQALRAVSDDTTTLLLIDRLAASVPQPVPVIASTLDPQLQARMALAHRNFDDAVKWAEALEPDDEHVLLLIEIAVLSGDVPYATRALTTFQSLDEKRQRSITESHPHISLQLAMLAQFATPPVPVVVDIETIDNWPSWLARVIVDPSNNELGRALEQLVKASDEATWTIEDVARLSNELEPLALSPELLSRSLVKQAMGHLTSLFLNDISFPREDEPYRNVYEALYTALLERHEVNQTHSLSLIRLAEALLRRSPTRRDEVLRHLQHWFNTPVPALEISVLESFELLAEYGIAGSQLLQWYRDWASTIVGLPGRRERTSIETWLSFGTWVQPGADMIGLLREALAATGASAADSPVSGLPPGYRIGIFTLRRSSGERARELLLGCNPGLDIRICTETDLNDSARAIAQNSDMAVIVTTCISHALTYGIGPYLKQEPVYPASSGSTSIVRAVENSVR